jgi:3-dehydroquinate synthase
VKKIHVNIKKPYDILVGDDVLKNMAAHIEQLHIGDHAVIITNKTVHALYGKKISAALKKSRRISFETIVLPDSERIKSFDNAESISRRLAHVDFKKRPFLVGAGGGVITDLTGFVASITKRGIPYISIATTLLAQVDAAIGGKTAIDLPEGKNLVGTFWQPRLVMCDVGLQKTLPCSQVREGLAEVIKYGLTLDKKVFELVDNGLEAIFKSDATLLNNIVTRCVLIKKTIVEQDEYEEKGIRTILNFGHTVGHALESASDYSLSHGNAVSIGMVAALYLSEEIGILCGHEVITKTIGLLKRAGIPATFKNININRAINALKRDKKFVNGTTRFVLLKSIGQPVVVENIALSDVSKILHKITG